MCASSCWKRRTLVRPVSVPDSSFLWRTPKSASLRGSSLQERGLWPNIRLQDEQKAEIAPTHTQIAWAMSSAACTGLALPVAGTVHGLQRKDIFFCREGEHVLTVVLPVTRCLPKSAVVDIGRGHLLEASSPVLLLAQQSNISEQWEPASCTAAPVVSLLHPLHLFPCSHRKSACRAAQRFGNSC